MEPALRSLQLLALQLVLALCLEPGVALSQFTDLKLLLQALDLIVQLGLEIIYLARETVVGALKIVRKGFRRILTFNLLQLALLHLDAVHTVFFRSLV